MAHTQFFSAEWSMNSQGTPKRPPRVWVWRAKGVWGSTGDVRGIKVKFTGKATGEVGNNLVVFIPPAESTVEPCYYLNSQRGDLKKSGLLLFEKD